MKRGSRSDNQARYVVNNISHGAHMSLEKSICLSSKRKTTRGSPYVWRVRPLVSPAPGDPAVTCSPCPSRPACILRWGRPSHGSPAETSSLAPPSRGSPAPPALPAPPRRRPEPAARCPLSARRPRRAPCRVSAHALPAACLQRGRPPGSWCWRGPGLPVFLCALLLALRPNVPGSWTPLPSGGFG